MTPGDLSGDELIVLDHAAKYHPDIEHPLQVRMLSLRLFDDLQQLHCLDRDDRRCLSYAALLHDIGWAYGRSKHHKRSMDLILGDESLPFDRRERQIIAAIARYHRKAHPKQEHENYRLLSYSDQKRVCALAALLRIADGLDYTHCSVVRDISATLNEHMVYIHCIADIPASAELAQAMKKSRLFSETYNREVHISWEIRKKEK